MQSISDLLNIEKIKEKDARLQVFELYCSESEKKLRKIQNWKRYVLFLKENGLKNTDEEQRKFKKNKRFVKEYSITQFCILTSHIPKDDWFYNLSIAKDRYNRNESIGAWLFGSIFRRD